jgi:hypothetical protein
MANSAVRPKHTGPLIGIMKGTTKELAVIPWVLKLRESFVHVIHNEFVDANISKINDGTINKMF